MISSQSSSRDFLTSIAHSSTQVKIASASSICSWYTSRALNRKLDLNSCSGLRLHGSLEPLDNALKKPSTVLVELDIHIGIDKNSHFNHGITSQEFGSLTKSVATLWSFPDESGHSRKASSMHGICTNDRSFKGLVECLGWCDILWSGMSWFGPWFGRWSVASHRVWVCMCAG